MRLGVELPRELLSEDPDWLHQVARLSEQSNVATVWMSDHLVMTDDAVGYPYTTDKSFSRKGDTPWYEVLSVLTWLAALSCRVQVGTCVLVLPQRNALETAKVAATLDQLSRGRLMLGVGAGWFEEEFEALGYDYTSRGRRMDSAIDLMRRAWTGTVPRGQYGDIEMPHDLRCYPTPFRPGGVPVLVGGMTKRAVRRVKERGDGWLARTWVEEFLADPEQLATTLEGIRIAQRDANPLRPKPNNVLRLVHRTPLEVGSGNDMFPPGAREAVRLAQEIGFDEAVVSLDWQHGSLRSEFSRLALEVS